MKHINLRVVKSEGKTKEGRKFPRYYAVYSKNGERAYIDVSFSGDTLNTYLSAITNRHSQYLDLSLAFAQKKEERSLQHAFIAPKRKKNEDGTYSFITDRKGNQIPHVVITKLEDSDILPLDKPIVLPESKTEKAYEVDNFFGISDSDTDMPF